MEEITNKIKKTTSAKWRQACGFLHDHQVPFRLKEQFSKMAWQLHCFPMEPECRKGSCG